jgi:hypothetical protein
MLQIIDKGMRTSTIQYAVKTGAYLPDVVTSKVIMVLPL